LSRRDKSAALGMDRNEHLFSRYGEWRRGKSAALEELVNLSETWRRLLADFRPVAKAAAERTDGVSQFGANGFVQV